MPRVDIAITELPRSWSTTAKPITWTSANTTENHRFKATGYEILLVRNTNATTARQFTVVSTPDQAGRTGDLVHSVPANGTVVTQVFPLIGWVQSDGYIYVNTQADLQFAVLRIL